MVNSSSRFFLFGVFLVFSILFCLNFVVADFNDCWVNTGTSESTCIAVSGCQWETNATDPWCDQSPGCCMDIGCWDYDGTNSSTCEANDGTMNCTWDPYFTMWYPNGTQSATVGGCMQDWDGGEIWGGMEDGAWIYDGDKAACGLNNYIWKPNAANENTWCGVKSLTDAQNKNPSATADDIGCCEQAGCWSYDGNESTCGAVFDGVCYYENSSYGSGWCMSQSCSFADGNQTQCNTLKNDLYMPCNWVNDSGQEECDDAYMDGGFGFYNTTDSCFDQGGWYNSTGDCVMPSGDFAGGGGGFLFGGSATCWFADNQVNVCGNVTGCAYCVAGSGVNGVENVSSENICSRKQIGFCEGHDVFDTGSYANANNSASLSCSDIGIKSACKYGPLPNCKWDNSTSNIGDYCSIGTSSERKAEPPVPFCEHPDSKDNYTICSQLIDEFMMPCVWDNSSSVVKNCTFNGNAVFGTGEQDFEIISSESSCTAAGGSWNTEYYVDDGILKQDSWCEMTGFFDIDDGMGEGNKGNCDTSCWACEFQSDGSAWGDVGAAASACSGSALGYCSWTANNDSFSGFGWCDYPQEMEEAGGKDCNTECGGCDFMPNAEAACTASVASSGCKWVNDTNNADKGGFCVDKIKKVCNSDCFSCFDDTSCYGSSLSCAWDTEFGLCGPQGFEGEVCFDGIDNDGDNMVDCTDPDCGFDNFCGGSSFGGDCFSKINEGSCNQTFAFALDGEDLNCTWLNDTWNTDGWCDMPGMNCWTFDNDLATCGVTPGCTNDSSSMGMAANMCDINKTKMDTANCWVGTNATCDGLTDCQWNNDIWCTDNPADPWCLSSGGGWCDYKPFAQCMGLNASSCGGNSNCTWSQDEYSMQGGWCDVACFNWSISSSGECEGAGSAGLCEWRDMSATCQPEMFMIFGTDGGGAGGGSSGGGCWSYDGNETACLENDVTCVYKNDTYANNNWSVDLAAGWCMSKGEFEHFGEMKGDVIQLADDSDNFGIGGPEAEAGVSGEVDIVGMGMRVTDEGLNFGAGIINISDSIICNGHFVSAGPGSPGEQGNGNKSGGFYWYLDTDGNESGGCVAYGGVDGIGYDFMINYIARNTTGGVVETKQLMRCNAGEWSPTNALVTTSKQMSCGEIGGVMVAIASEDLEAYSAFDTTANMRIFMSSVNDTDTREAPSDYVGPGYYTPGSIDFAFVDCSDPDSKDPKCKNVQKFGFNVFEECMNGIDDDENGLIDCLDPMCLFTPKCAGGSAFSFDVDLTDKVAPIVTYSEVEELSDVAFVRIDTNEPSSLNLTFYGNDSDCAVENITIEDIGSGYQDNAKYKPFHDVDLVDQNLENGTSYYYKTTTCDTSGNCAVSACANFTTKTSQVDKEFIFKIDLPDNFTVDIPALNKTDYNFTESFNISGVPTEFEVGIKTNTSVTKDMNMTVYCGDMAIGFFGMNVLGPTKIDLTNGFICNESEDLMGMNSSLKKWNKLIDELHLGGATDYIELTIPVAYSASNNLTWSDDDGTDGEDVTTFVNCSNGGNSNTVCKVPVSMGFSAYTITTPTAAVVINSGGSSGGGVTTNTTAVNASADEGSEGDEDGDALGGVPEGGATDSVDNEGLGETNLKSILIVSIPLIILIGVIWYFLAGRFTKGKDGKFVEIKVK
jgi:hypothetical protein